LDEPDSSEGDGRGTNSSDLVLLKGVSSGLKITFSGTVTGGTQRNRRLQGARGIGPLWFKEVAYTLPTPAGAGHQ
jgi:hypothetical protein